MNAKSNYDSEAIKLAIAIDIAIESIKKYPPEDFNEAHINHFVKTYLEWKDSVLNPERKLRSVASLKYDIQSVFTYFQEGNGRTLEFFWKRINQENLGYVREDKLRKIIKRGKIKGRIEYEYVIDLIVVAQQEGRITEEEAIELSTLIGEFEKRKRK